MASPRCLGFLLILLAALSGCGNADHAPPGPTPTRIERALSAAATYLASQQGPDGAWRPETYGPFKDGASLTPLVLQAFAGLPASESRAPVLRKGIDFLLTPVQPDGSIHPGPRGFSYPVYTAANAILVLSQPSLARYHKERAAWLAYLRARQLTEELGWQPTDRAYGGWGYASGLPRKPEAGAALPALTESNLSATAFALAALRAAGVGADDPAVQKALVFVQRCQNYSLVAGQRAPQFDDGGFYFIYDDAVRNKAGVAGTDRMGRQRYVSYGSATADGLRALLACGLSPADERVAAARNWLARHFIAAHHPGAYVKEREGDRPALDFYYCCAAAQALHALGIAELQTPTGRVAWAERLADELLARQRTDGSWVNSAKAVREDEPVLATSFAMIALTLCQAHRTEQSARDDPAAQFPTP